MRTLRWILAVALLALPLLATAAAPGIPLVNVQPAAGGGQNWTMSLQVLVLMTALTLLPAIALMMTSFTRIIIVLGFLRQALGTQSTPPNQVLLGLALFLTLFVMSPVLNTRLHRRRASRTWMARSTAELALPAASAPFKHFMLDQTREADLQLFARSWPAEGPTPARPTCRSRWRCRRSSPAN